MTRRTDQLTAEKVSLALLAREAFGFSAGVRTATFFRIPMPLMAAIFSRAMIEIRKDVQGVGVKADRRRQQRKAAHATAQALILA